MDAIKVQFWIFTTWVLFFVPLHYDDILFISLMAEISNNLRQTVALQFRSV